MRIMLLTPLLLLGACNVTTDSGNNQVTLQYNKDAAARAASDVGNTAENIGTAIGNEAQETANKIDNSKIIAHGDNKAATETNTNKQ